MSQPSKATVLLILDGWGHRDPAEDNAVTNARTPTWDRLWQRHPHTLIEASGPSVGLPAGQMGNSEVGHLNLGAGRVVYQEFTRVSRAIRTGSFFRNRTLTNAVDQAVENDKAVHIMGLLSPGGVHSHQEHLEAMARLALERGAKDVRVHAFLDGRDTPPKSAAKSLESMQALFDEHGSGRIATLIGRYYAMDRDNRWPRIKKSYELMVDGVAEHSAPDPLSALEAAYARGETDEFVLPTVIGEPGCMSDGDSLVFMNYRSDRARQLTRALVEDEFDGFERRRRPALGSFASLTEYAKDYPVPVAFPPERIDNGLGEQLSNQGMRQLRLAETEKYAHVTFFFNGGREEPFGGEDRILVASPDVATYDLAPAMSIGEVTDKLIAAIDGGRYDVVVCNFANPDMVGHSGLLAPAMQAIEAVDGSLARVLATVDRVGGQLLVTADHGNAEQMRDATGPHTAHTSNPVPLIYYGPRNTGLRKGGALCDIAPTLLDLLALPQPGEMQGQSLLIPPEPH